MKWLPFDRILLILPLYSPLPLNGTTPKVEPVKTQKSLFKLIFSFFTLFKTNLNEFNGLI